MTYPDKYKFLPNVPTHDVDMEHEFIHLIDTPATYSGFGNFILKVGTTESGIEFVNPDEVSTPVMVEDEGISVQNTPHTTLNFIGNGVVASDGGSGVADITIPGCGDLGYFGHGFLEASSENESYTNSTTYIQKLKLSIPDIGAGKYRIGWSYEWSQENSNWRFEGRVQLNDSIDLSEIVVRPSKSTWKAWHPAAGFKYETLASGSHTVDIDYCTSKSNKTAGIRRARIEFWRVS